jgi:uncharacterized protein (DUF924 family)
MPTVAPVRSRRFVALPLCLNILTLHTSPLHTVSAMKVVDFVRKPFIQRACAEPHTIPSVLSFFFGLDCHDPAQVQAQLRDGGALTTMKDLWFAGGSEYDQLCARHFADTIRAAGNGQLARNDPAWTQQVDGVVAQLVLCDQLARNAFRGTPEAYAYDQPALRLARTLHTDYRASRVANASRTIQGEYHPPYVAFLVTAFMHSEVLTDHEAVTEILQHERETTPEHLHDWWRYQETFEQEHRDVVERFGRYPHRNALHQRQSTPVEEAWLDDTENLPCWALSQLQDRTECAEDDLAVGTNPSA